MSRSTVELLKAVLCMAANGDGDDDNDPPPDPNDPPPPSCNFSITLLAAEFTTENLNRWPDGAVLAPPPSASPWQWHRNAGAVLPVVLWFGNYVQPHILASVNAGLSCPTAWHVRARAEGTVLADAFVGSGDWSGPGTVGTAELWLDELNSPTWNDTVSRRVQGIHFDFSLDGGESWSYFGTAQPTCWYVMPGGDALPSGHLRYDLALNKVAQYASGLSSVSAIAGAVNSGIAGEIYYDPNEVVGYHELRVYDPPRRAMCFNHARLLSYLARSCGIPAEARTTWGGSSPGQVDYYLPPWASIELLCPAHDAAPANPRFTYHAVTLIRGTYYDPSYGSTGAPVITEACQPYSVDPYGIVTCGPPAPDCIPQQRWGITFPPATELLVPCGGAPLP